MKAVAILAGLCLFGMGRSTLGAPDSGPPTVAAWISDLSSASESNRLHAAQSLVALGPIVSKQVWGAIDVGYGPKGQTEPALDAFVKLGSQAVPMMLAIVEAERSGDLWHNPGIDGILRMGSNALPGLKLSLNSPEWKTRGAAIAALRLLQGESGDGSAELLLQAAHSDTDEKLRIYAVDALGYGDNFHGVPKTSCEGLRKLLRDDSEKIRITAAYSLAKCCHDSSSDVLAELIKGVRQPDTALEWECIFAMNFIGTNAAPALPALPALVEALQKGDAMVSSEAGRVLAQIGGPAFPALESAAYSSNQTVRIGALQAIPDLAINATNFLDASIDILSKGLKDSDRGIRQNSLNSLRRIGTERKDLPLSGRIIQLIAPLCSDPDQWIRSDAKWATVELEK